MSICKAFVRSSRRKVALASACCVLACGTALAADAGAAAPSVTVDYRDLNLSTLEGATTLYGRIRDAARSVCAEPSRDLSKLHRWNECYRSAVAGGVATVNNPMLTGVYHRYSRGADVTAMLTP
jgi:UrcA family protein